MKYRSHWPTFILRSSIKSYWHISPKYHVYTSNCLQDIRKNHEPWNTGHSDTILIWDNASSHTDSLFHGIMFIHQQVFKIYGKITEPWNIGQSDPSYWLISPSYHVYTSNSLQDIRQNHWTMKYRSQWPTFIFRCSIKSYWLIGTRYHVYISISLPDIRQNHWTMKYRS